MQIAPQAVVTRLGVLLAFSLICASHASGQVGSIDANPNPCTIPGGQYVCNTTISWSSQGTSEVQVWASLNGGAESAFASSGVGGPYNQSASWIQGPPNSYVFRLYDYSGGSRGALLASRTVTGIYNVNLTWGNTTHTTISPHIVVGDYWTLNITGAAPGAPIVLQYQLNGGQPASFTLGYADNNDGHYYEQEQVGSGSVGIWSDQWYVGGVAVGNPIPFEVIRRPFSTSVMTQSVYMGCSSYYLVPNGILGQVRYQIKDVTGANVTSQNIPLNPYVQFGQYYQSIGATNPGSG